MIAVILGLAWALPGAGGPAASCAPCHGAVHAQWAGSRHALAGSNEVFAASFEHFPHPWCLSCHAPTGSREEGVSCAVCHAVDEPADPVKSCARCHEFPFQNHTPAEPFSLSQNPSQSTVSEWQGSSAAADGITCVRCHMGEHGHRFPGAHEPALLQDWLVVQVTPVDATHVDVQVRAPGAAHRVPTGDPFRRIEVRLCADPTCEVVVGTGSLRQVIARTETSWRLAEDRTIPAATATEEPVRTLRLPVSAPARWWQLDYRYGDRRFEAALPAHAVGYRIAAGPVGDRPAGD